MERRSPMLLNELHEEIKRLTDRLAALEQLLSSEDPPAVPTDR
jgi:hypothetical protein